MKMSCQQNGYQVCTPHQIGTNRDLWYDRVSGTPDTWDVLDHQKNLKSARDENWRWSSRRVIPIMKRRA
jgi:hypothetical protein